LRSRSSRGALVLWLLGACTPKHAPSPTVAEPSGRATTSASAAPFGTAPVAPLGAERAARCADEPSNTLAADAVTAFAERFRQTQKAGDFAGYASLYGEHFSGLLWDGVSFSRLDRDHWLRAHRGLLALGSELAGARVQVAVGGGGAQIHFRASPSDPRSLPELFVVATSSGLQIVREAPARPEPSQLTEQPGVWLADERFATLSTRPEVSWLEGAATFDGNATALSNVAVARLPKALRGWLGRPVRVVGAAGTVCETRLQRFAIRSQITPELATAERWDGCGDAPISPAAIAREIVQLTAFEGRTLVAELATPCKGALLAMDPDLPAPALATPAPASAELGETALAALRKLPSYASTQTRFRTEQPNSEGMWEDHDARRGVWALALPGRKFVFASVTAGTGCSGFSASITAIWQEHEGSLELLGELAGLDEKRVSPNALFDLDSGAPKLLLGPDGDYRAVRVFSPETRAARVLSSVPFFAGPC